MQSKSYQDKKRFFDGILTIYGRQAVAEALSDTTIKIYKLHLSSSNKPANILKEIESMALSRNIPIELHDKKALSRISKNARQDQGVALDIIMTNYTDTTNFLSQYKSYKLLALDGITNPQNTGMIIRSATAGDIDAVIIPTKGTSSITPLVIKASVGTLFKLPVIRTQNLVQTLKEFLDDDATLYNLNVKAKESLFDTKISDKSIFVLGNESNGVSKEVADICNKEIKIPMNRGVESLNVAVTASLLAFCR